MWTNYHTHTSYCDGKKNVADVIASANAQGLRAIGLSSHAPLPFSRKWCMAQDELTHYLRDIENVKATSSIEVYAGLETDYIPGKISPRDFRASLDYVIGSVHFVDEQPNGDGWEIDGPYDEFLKGYNSTFKGSMRNVVSRYYELTRQMVTNSTPDIVGHLDKIKMQNKEQSTFREEEPWYVDEIEKTLGVIREAGCIVEINTRGIYQMKTTTTYPSPWIVSRLADLGIPVTLASDAHHPDDLVNHFTEAAAMLLQCGIKKIRILTNGKWRDAGFDEHGIKDYKVAL
jgi:histidinol-phosphatase (PHP family)